MAAELTAYLSVAVLPSQHAKLDALAHREGVTLSTYVRAVLAAHLAECRDIPPPRPARPYKIIRG